jgi:hypothetical protein
MTTPPSYLNDWATDPAVLARVLTRLRRWNEAAAPAQPHGARSGIPSSV